jgi:hypothetical protein
MCQLSFGRKSSGYLIIKEFYVRNLLQKCDRMTEFYLNLFIQAQDSFQMMVANSEISF